jgi:hypothetical protein
MQIVNGHSILDGMVSIFIVGTIPKVFPDIASCHPDREAVRMMIPPTLTVSCLDGRRSTELTTPLFGIKAKACVPYNRDGFSRDQMGLFRD